MPSEASFLQAIAAAPEDRSVRLVYADWLEDRDDPRAELIRIEEEMRTLPVFADRYWALKARRNQLRTGQMQTWLTALGYGIGYEPMLRIIPDGWRERWRLIREFCERWHGQALPDVGGECEAVARFAQITGRVPASVREWAAFHRDIGTGPTPVRDGEFIADRVADREALVIFEELFPPNRLLYYAVLERDLTLDDPPVYCFLDVPDEFPLAAGTVSGLVLLTLLYQGKGMCGFRTNEPTPSAVEELSALLGPAGTIEGHHLFEADNLLVQVSDRYLGVDFKAAPAAESIPALLWDYAAATVTRYGIFLDRLRPRPEDIPF
jgi:uncharacterized protein (TIGR02996 family)